MAALVNYSKSVKPINSKYSFLSYNSPYGLFMTTLKNKTLFAAGGSLAV